MHKGNAPFDLILGTRQSKWSVSHPDHFVPREREPANIK